MANAQRKKTARFGLAANKAATDEKVGEMLHAVQSHVADSESDDETKPHRPPQSTASAPRKGVSMSAPVLASGPTRLIETTPRIREQVPIGATFSQKCAVSYIERFNLLCKDRGLVKRDMLEEGLDYILQKYEALKTS